MVHAMAGHSNAKTTGPVATTTIMHLSVCDILEKTSANRLYSAKRRPLRSRLMKDALQGVKVVALGGYAAGPYIGKYLANFGAQVVHVESTEHPDGFRLQYPPYRDG